MEKGCGIEFPLFGASYPDARCCDGYLWDMDSWDESLGGMTIGGDDPCPVCNTEAWLENVMKGDVFNTKEDAIVAGLLFPLTLPYAIVWWFVEKYG